SYWIPGSYAPTWSEKRTSVFKAIKKEGLQGATGDHNGVGRPRQITTLESNTSLEAKTPELYCTWVLLRHSYAGPLSCHSSHPSRRHHPGVHPPTPRPCPRRDRHPRACQHPTDDSPRNSV